MKRLSGGLVLLNLTAISLGLTSGEVNITDAGILEELTELRQFIDVNRDFSKGFKNLKPIMIEYRSSASKFNGITQANLSFNTDALHMSIGANTIQADGKLLVITINVVYEYTDYVGYTIKSAKLNAYETLADGDATFTGDVGVGGDLSVIGNAILPEINGEENPSVKPIYCHPCFVNTEFTEGEYEGRKYLFTCLIFNNDPTPFTLATFMSYVSNLCNNYGAKIMISGAMYDLVNSIIATCIEYDETYEKVVLKGLVSGSSNVGVVGFTTMNASNTTFADGVNKIN